MLHAEMAGEPWKRLSIILPSVDPADPIDFVAERLRYEALLAEVGITLGVFGLDLSANEDRREPLDPGERFQPHACVHAYGFAPAAEVDAAWSKLGKLVTPTEAIRRPVLRGDFNGNLAAIAYAFKPSFQGRHTILQHDPRRAKLVRNTRDRPLTVAQELDAVRALDRGGLSGRVLLLGLEFGDTAPSEDLPF